MNRVHFHPPNNSNVPGSLLVSGLGMLFFCLAMCSGTAAGSLKEDTYKKLDRIRQERKHQLESYLERVEKVAEAISTDPKMLKYFEIKLRYCRLKSNSTPPPEAVEMIEHLRRSLRNHYLQEYSLFYDILFVDSDGYVFSTIRHEKDYNTNLLKGRLSESALGKHLRNHSKESFVDYDFYSASDEPSAFFIEPVKIDGEHAGWIIPQCSVNKINSIFARGKALLLTGEVFLVNSRHQMLTDSHFKPDSSILTQHLSKENIESKFAERKGHKTVTDYRGFRALTSFEVCPVMNSEWLLIAKIDEAEVITRYYMDHEAELQPALLAALKKQTPVSCKASVPSKEPTIVDIDEFHRARSDEQLMTFGVSTCTAILMILPDEFAYMGHASAYDRMYGQGDMDIMSHMLQKIRMFEIYPYQLRYMQIIIVAPHLDSIANVVHTLLEQGFFLSQIKFLYNADARSATVIFDMSNNRTLVKWKSEDDTSLLWQCAKDSLNMGEMLKPIIGYGTPDE